MSGGQRKWSSGHSKWRIQWMDEAMFKVEHENDAMTDRALEEWTAWMDAQIEERFAGQRPKGLVASSLNFSRNCLGNEGMRSLVEYLRGREIGVQTLKLFRNSIGDVGAYAIGKLLAHAPVPVHEVHLSHNALTEQGACSVLESIARSGRYPYVADHAGRKDQRGLAPVWLRMEHNCINWSSIEHRLEQRQLLWCTADSRDGWHPKERAPMVCMHNSFRNQNADQVPSSVWGGGGVGDAGAEEEEAWPHDIGREVPLNGQLILAALQGDDAAKQSLDVQLGQVPRNGGGPLVDDSYRPPPVEQAAEEEVGEENVPLYVFLDAGAVNQMLMREGLFTFQGLLNLCQQGHMKCTPPDRRPLKPWVGPVEERDCIMLVLTDTVLDELSETAERDAAARRRFELLRSSADPYLQRCLEWGIVEMLETVVHTRLMRLTPDHERLALELRIQHPALKMLDFVSLWESQIEMEGRVLLVTADEALCRFGVEAKAAAPAQLCPSVIHYDELSRRFQEDTLHGGMQLCEAALNKQARKFCGAVLSAAHLASIVCLAGALPPPPPQEGSDEPASASAAAGGRSAEDGRATAEAESKALRLELQEALELVVAARRLLASDARDTEASRCAERMDAAAQRWRALLGTTG